MFLHWMTSRADNCADVSTPALDQHLHIPLNPKTIYAFESVNLSRSPQEGKRFDQVLPSDLCSFTSVCWNGLFIACYMHIHNPGLMLISVRLLL